MEIKINGKVIEVVERGGNAAIQYGDHLFNKPLLDRYQAENIYNLVYGQLPPDPTPYDVYRPIIEIVKKLGMSGDWWWVGDHFDPTAWTAAGMTYAMFIKKILETGGLF